MNTSSCPVEITSSSSSMQMNPTSKSIDIDNINPRIPAVAAMTIRSHNTVKKLYRCNLCKYTTEYSGALSRHKRIHSNKRFECPECNNKYLEKYELKSHMESAHSTQLLCDCCSKVFTSRQGLKQHQQRHKNQFRYSCSVCGKGFLNKSHFESHENNHRNFKPYSCTCGRSYTYKQSYTVHKQRCRGPKAMHYSCTQCNNIFNTRHSLKEHVTAKHSSIVFVCKKCSKTFKWRPSYNRHIRHCSNSSSLLQDQPQCNVQD